MFKSTMSVAALVVAALVSSAQGQQKPEDTSEQFYISCQNRFAVIFPDGVRPMMRDITYAARNGANLPARQFYVERGMNWYSVTVVAFPTGAAVDEASIDFAAANLRTFGEVPVQAERA